MVYCSIGVGRGAKVGEEEQHDTTVDVAYPIKVAYPIACGSNT